MGPEIGFKDTYRFIYILQESSCIDLKVFSRSSRALVCPEVPSTILSPFANCKCKGKMEEVNVFELNRNIFPIKTIVYIRGGQLFLLEGRFKKFLGPSGHSF